MMSLFVTIPEDCHLIIDGVDYAGREVHNMFHNLDGTGYFTIDYKINGNICQQKIIYMNEAQNKQVMIACCSRQIDYLRNQLKKEQNRLLELSGGRLNDA